MKRSSELPRMRRAALPGVPAAQQSAMPDDFNRVWGAPSSSDGFSEGPPPIGQLKKPEAGGPIVSVRTLNMRMSSSSLVANANVQTLVGANQSRRYLAIQNNGTVNIFLGFGTTPRLDSQNSLRLPPNTGITFDLHCPNNEVTVIAPNTCLVSIIEGCEV